MIAEAIAQMIEYYHGNHHDVAHFLKVWSYARTIGELEHLDPDTQTTLELAAVVHDIACPLCREKYGNTAGPNQEREGIPLAREFYREAHLPEEQLERICFLVGHHHTYSPVQGIDYQILLEADALVNADESSWTPEQIAGVREHVFRTQTGLRLLDSVYPL